MAKKQKINEVEEVNKVATFTLSLTLGDKVYETAGEDVVEMLLSIKPEFVKTKGVYVLKSGGKVAQEVRILPLVKKIATNKDNAIMFAKYLVERLK